MIGITKRIARNFRHRRGDSGLVLRIESDQARNLSSPLARGHDIILILQGDIDDRAAHTAKPVEPVRMT
jgi:hypothetical protein